MPWPKPTLRDRRRQVAGDIAQHLPGADATVPNSVLRVIGDAQADLTRDNDDHLDYVARMMMPDTAEGVYAERWANIWLPAGRKPATFAGGSATVTGGIGAAVATGAELVANVFDGTGQPVELRFEVVAGVTLSGPSAAVPVLALTEGALANLDEGAQLAWLVPPAGIDGYAVVAAPGLTGGADAERDAELIERYVARIQDPPHGGAAHDYVGWALEVPGVTRAWAASEAGIGTITVRIMLDDVRADQNGLPNSGDLATMTAYLAVRRPVTVAQAYILAPVAQPMHLTIDNLAGDTPEVRSNIETELRAMLLARSAPGQLIYASWVREAVSAATGEDRHDLTVANVVPATAGHLVTFGSVTYV